MGGRHWFLLVLVGCLSAWGGWAARGRRADAQAQIQAAVAGVHHATALAEQRAAKIATDRANREAKGRIEAEQQLAAAKARQAVLPRPEPVAPPPEDADLHRQLAVDLQEPPRLRADAVRVWTWREDAQRLPATAALLGACEDVNRAHETREAAGDRERAALTEALGHTQAALAAETRRGDALQVTASVPRWTTGAGTFMDTRAHRLRPVLSFGTYLNRNTVLESGAIPGQGAFVRVIHTWGRK